MRRQILLIAAILSIGNAACYAGEGAKENVPAKPDLTPLEVPAWDFECEQWKAKDLQLFLSNVPKEAANKPENDSDMWRHLFWLRAARSRAVAQKVARDAFLTHPSWATPHLYMAHELEAGLEDEEAFAEFDKVIALRPNFVNGRWLRGNALRKAGKNKESLADIEVALKYGRIYHPIWLDIKARNLYAMKRYEECYKVCRECLKLAPKYFSILELQVRALIDLKKYNEAEAVLKEVRSQNVSGYGEFYYVHMAKALHGQGRDKEALPNINSAIKTLQGKKVGMEYRDALATRAVIYDSLGMKSSALLDRKSLDADCTELFKEAPFAKH